MISIGKELGTEYVADPLAYSYLLYNDIKPINNDDEVVTELFKNDDVNYMIDYAGAPYAAYNYVEDEEDLSLVAEFYREPTAWGVRKNIGIFEKAERTELNAS